jgi:hypothetical protein
MVFGSKISSVRSSLKYLTLYYLAKKIGLENTYFENFKKELMLGYSLADS